MKNIKNLATRYFGLTLENKNQNYAISMQRLDDFIKNSKKIFLLNENWFVFAMKDKNQLFLSRQVVGYVPGISELGFSFLDFLAEDYTAYPLSISSLESFVWEESHFNQDKMKRLVWEINPDTELANSSFSLQVSNS